MLRQDVLPSNTRFTGFGSGRYPIQVFNVSTVRVDGTYSPRCISRPSTSRYSPSLARNFKHYITEEKNDQKK